MALALRPLGQSALVRNEERNSEVRRFFMNGLKRKIPALQATNQKFRRE
jgi:hypothetical protein